MVYSNLGLLDFFILIQFLLLISQVLKELAYFNQISRQQNGMRKVFIQMLWSFQAHIGQYVIGGSPDVQLSSDF